MQKRVLAAAVIICGVVGALIAAAASSSALPVVTVDQLVQNPASGAGRSALRIGARVADVPIDYQTSPTPPRFRLAFTVSDIAVPASQMKVVYYGIMPDTLKAGRDVILEGSFDGSTFAASDIKTQCPSKYEPPVPGQKKIEGGESTSSY